MEPHKGPHSGHVSHRQTKCRKHSQATSLSVFSIDTPGFFPGDKVETSWWQSQHSLDKWPLHTPTVSAVPTFSANSNGLLMLQPQGKKNQTFGPVQYPGPFGPLTPIPYAHDVHQYTLLVDLGLWHIGFRLRPINSLASLMYFTGCIIFGGPSTTPTTATPPPTSITGITPKAPTTPTTRAPPPLLISCIMLR